jgi:hypothetical protein
MASAYWGYVYFTWGHTRVTDYDSDENMSFEFNDLGLSKIIKALSAENVHVKVGILGDGNGRSDGEKTNAEIGAIHEFNGRSFLRMPLIEHLNNELLDKGAFDEETLKAIVKEGSLVPWMKKAGVIAENVIQKAFDTGGYGKWRPSNMKYKKTKMTLIETRQLRKAITSKVEG